MVQSRSPSDTDYQIYVAYEQAFPLADGWLAIASLIGVLGLRKMRTWGVLFMLIAGGSAIFLGLMDLSYDLEHNMFFPLTSESAIELVIVTLVLVLGPLEIGLLWSQRDKFFKQGVS